MTYDLFPMFVVGLLNGKRPKAWLEIGCWLNRHFVALVNVEKGSPIQNVRRCGKEVKEEMNEWRQFGWPLRTPTDFKRLLSCRHIRPTVMVGMEFSDAVRGALEEAGTRAVSARMGHCRKTLSGGCQRHSAS